MYKRQVHDLVRIAKSRSLLTEFEEKINILQKSSAHNELISTLKFLVPEFTPQNIITSNNDDRTLM